jgi:hypothetical protein
MVTAGHCNDSFSTRVLRSNPGWIPTSSCRTFSRLLQYYDDSNNPEVDFQFQVGLGSSGSCLSTYADDVCSAAQWSATGSFYKCTQYLDLAGYTDTNPVGTSLRTFGAKSSAVNIATIINNLFDPCGPCSADYVLIEATTADYGSGDSGGPVRAGSTLQGILKSVSTTDASRAVYTKAGEIRQKGPIPIITGNFSN